MATFTWTVLAVDVSTEVLAGHDDIVTVVYWRCIGEQDGYSAKLERNTIIPYDPATYVPYPDLTEAQMLAWIKSAEAYKPKDQPAVTVQTATESEIQNMIDVQINPPVISPALPWIS